MDSTSVGVNQVGPELQLKGEGRSAGQERRTGHLRNVVRVGECLPVAEVASGVLEVARLR